MRRLLVGVSVVVLSACQREEAAPVPWLSVPPSTPAGLATIDFGVEPGLGSTMSLRVSQGDTVVLEHSETLGLSQGHVAFQPDVGAYTATLEVTRQGEVVASTSADFRVFPTLTVNRRLPRWCYALAALNDEASAFDCDGTVIDADGGVPGFSGFRCDSRVVRTSSSTVRWRRCGSTLSAETPQGVSNAVAFPGEVEWAAADDFAVAGNTLAMLHGQTLELVDWDGREFVAPPPDGLSRPPAAPVVAVSRDGRRGIMFRSMWTFDQLAAPSPHTFCLLEFDVRWRLTACPALNGVYLRQERDGRVLFQRDAELLRVDLTDPEHPELIRALEPGLQFQLGTGLKQEGFEFQSTLTRTEPFALVVPVPEGWPPKILPDGSVSSVRAYSYTASSELVWGIDYVHNETFWAPLP